MLTVDSDKVVKPIDVKLYGHFLEHIYHSLNGGLWGEVVWNRSFEEGLPRPGGRGRGAPTQPEPSPPAGGTAARHWMLVGAPTAQIDTDHPFNSAKSMKIMATANNQGIRQDNYAVHAGDTLRGSIWLRGNIPGVIVRLVAGQQTLAEQQLREPQNDWQEIPLSLTPSATNTAAELQILTTGAGTVWIDQVSLMPDSAKATGGYRPDLLKAVADLKPATIRWPGGSYVGTNGGYRWKGGIGPQSQRVGKVGWDELDPSSFGTDEFIALCRKINVEPVIVVYLGSRQPGADHAAQVQEAAEWVEYCNGPATSKFGALRAANGHPEPYNVKYWEIDNEIWSMQPADYVRVVKEFITAMKKVDPSIIGIACGSGGYGARFAEGDLAVIADASDVVDYLSIHHYESSPRYAEGIGLAETYIQKLGDAIRASKNPQFKIYFSEWNMRRGIDWRNGLYAGGILTYFEREPLVTMACPALWLRHESAPDWNNALINFDQSRWFPGPNYVVMKLFRDHFAPQQVALSGDTGGLNVIATKSEDGKKLILKLVNPTEKAIDIKLAPGAAFVSAKPTMQLVAPDNLDATNSFEHPDVVKVTDVKVSKDGSDVTFSMPRWSVGLVELSN
jgi:alpha-N-arabinofuranosidase